MYQSIRILQLVCPIYRAPHSHLHDKKGHLRLVTKVPKRCNTLDFLQIESQWEGTCPTHFDSIIVKFTFNRNSGGRLAPDTHFTAASWKGPPACPESAHTSRLSSWTPAQHSVITGSYSKWMWQATRDRISGIQQCLVLVGWAGLYSLE